MALNSTIAPDSLPRSVSLDTFWLAVASGNPEDFDFEALKSAYQPQGRPLTALSDEEQQLLDDKLEKFLAAYYEDLKERVSTDYIFNSPSRLLANSPDKILRIKFSEI